METLVFSLNQKPAHALRLVVGALAFVASGLVQAHGDVTPQSVDISTLPKLGEKWSQENPYIGNQEALRVGSSAYNQNCARCHGLEAVSGGIAPDLRKLDAECASKTDPKKKQACVIEFNEYYTSVVLKGRVRNGAVYMPPFQGLLQQEAVWAIKTYLESRREKPL